MTDKSQLINTIMDQWEHVANYWQWCEPDVKFDGVKVTGTGDEFHVTFLQDDWERQEMVISLNRLNEEYAELIPMYDQLRALTGRDDNAPVWSLRRCSN